MSDRRVTHYDGDGCDAEHGRVRDPDPDPDVAAVLAEGFHGFNSLGECQCGYPTERSPEAMRTHQAEVALAALAAAGYAVVKADEIESLRAENERHQKANLVRAVVRYDAVDWWIGEAINHESFDRVPWLIAEKLTEENDRLRQEAMP